MRTLTAVMSPTIRRLGVVGTMAVLAAIVGGCSVEDTLPMPSCTEDVTASLGAQSVPTAKLVPCLDPLPEGWNVDKVRVDQDGMEVRFDSDRAGDNAAVFHYTATCDVGDAISRPSDQLGAVRFEHIERVAPGLRAQRYYVFDGGCIWWEFDFDADATAALAIDLGDRLQTVSRNELNESIRETFIDVEL